MLPSGSSVSVTSEGRPPSPSGGPAGMSGNTTAPSGVASAGTGELGAVCPTVCQPAGTGRWLGPAIPARSRRRGLPSEASGTAGCSGCAACRRVARDCRYRGSAPPSPRQSLCPRPAAATCRSSATRRPVCRTSRVPARRPRPADHLRDRGRPAGPDRLGRAIRCGRLRTPPPSRRLRPLPPPLSSSQGVLRTRWGHKERNRPTMIKGN
jgi:hypothetical protein